jgi:hypothetical protein
MSLCVAAGGRSAATFFVADDCHPQTIAVVQTRAEPWASRSPSARKSFRSRSGGLRACSSRTRPPTAVRRPYKDLAAKVHAAGRCSCVGRSCWPSSCSPRPASGGRHRHRQRPALRRAHGLRRPARRVHGHTREFAARCPAASSASPATPTATRLRLAIQTREQHIRREKRHQQHLHRPGPAGHHGLDVRRLPRPRGPQARIARACGPAPRPSVRRCSPSSAFHLRGPGVRHPPREGQGQGVRCPGRGQGPQDQPPRLRRRLARRHPGRDHRPPPARRPPRSFGGTGKEDLDALAAEAGTGHPRRVRAQAPSSRTPSSTATARAPRCCATSSSSSPATSR